MSQTTPPAAGGKAVKERRRQSADQPYRKQTRQSTMPTTRHSPSRGAQGTQPGEAGSLPLAGIMQELMLLRQAMETKFTEAGTRSDALRNEVIGKLDANDQAVLELQLAVTDVTLGVDKNQRAIHEVRAEVERREVELPEKVRAIVQEVLDRPGNRPTSSAGPRNRPLGQPLHERSPSPSPSPDPEPGNGRDEAYLKDRRSLRLWPVSREGNLHTRTVEFLVTELGLDQQYAVDLHFVVRRAGNHRNRDRAPGTQQVKDEVVLLFESVRKRDDVRSFAKNLERKGRGLRLEVPDHLWSSFRVLQGVAFELKQRNPTLRRNILFDDPTRDLKLDFSTDSITWKTISPDEARKSLSRRRPARSRRLSVSAADLDDLLGDQTEEVEMEN